MKSSLFILVLLFFWGCAGKPDPNSPETQAAITEAQNLGLAYLEENNLDEAEAQFLKITGLNPEDASGFANLGIVYLRRGEYSQAESVLQQALSLNPGDPAIAMNLADAYVGLEQQQQAIDVVTTALETASDNVPILYKRAQLLSEEPAQREAYSDALQQVIDIASANIVPRIQLIIALTQLENLNAAAFQLNELQQQLPELPREIQPHFKAAQEALAANDTGGAMYALRIFHNLMKVTPYYQTGLRLLNIRADALAGVPIISAPPSLTQSLQTSATALDLLQEMQFTDASTNAQLTNLLAAGQTATTSALADFDGDGDIDVFFAATNPNTFFLLQNDFGRFTDIAAAAGLVAPATQTNQALWVDFDNDTFLDLYLINAGSHQLFRNTGEGTFEDVSRPAGIDATSGGNAGLFVDLDHDGDLDLLLLQEAGARLLRNNADGTFTDQPDAMGLAEIPNGQDADLGDFDDDGDIDLLVAHANGISLFSNQRQGVFVDLGPESGITTAGPARASAVGDYNNDGFLDVLIASSNGLQLFNNSGTRFNPDTRSSQVLSTLTANFSDAKFFDFDNDGYLDLFLTGDHPALLHNDGSGAFTNESETLLAGFTEAAWHFEYTDYNLDRDLDLFLTTSAGPVLLRNDGGQRNRSLSIQTRGLLTNNSKNNYYSIGAKVEVRAGDLYQMRVVTSPATYVGLGQRLKADVVRIVFTNGVPQNIFTPGTDQDIIEQQILKGSCPFLYTWNGREFQFATDILWRSALGMPTGIMGGNTTYAPASPAEDYIRIPDNLLKVKDGKYQIRITGELWETPYFDEVKLMVVDHPKTVEALIDEKFGPPPADPLPIYSINKKHAPASATDGAGNDLLETLLAADSNYVSPGMPARYQGLTQAHDLILTAGDDLNLDQTVLYLKGWIFPTDASINMALTQTDALIPMPPKVQVKDAQGNWQTVIENMGFPMGKNKVVRIDLRGKFLSNSRQVRIRTNMQLYWDQAFFAEDVLPDKPETVRRTLLSPASAALQYRGFSKMYRTSPAGPHLYDYQEVTTETRWLDLEGRYTRYGDVLPLLQSTDHQYVIMNAGDEMAISFDASAAASLPPDWTRSFILYSNGWLKDGDLNTAHGNTVAPLPFAGMSAYPYDADESYPMTAANQMYMAKYNTRVVDRSAFRETLKP